MKFSNTIFNQLLQFLPDYEFSKLTDQFDGNRYTKYFTAKQHLVTMLYSQMKCKDSLRDIVTGLRMQSSKLYHLGLDKVCRSTLSDANNRRDWRIFEGLFYRLLFRCKDLTPKHKFRFKNPAYSIDSTTIDLCLSMFPWAKFRKRKGAIKLHCRFDHAGELPDFIVVTDGATHDVRAAKQTPFPIVPDSIISEDRAYIDYEWLNSIDEQKAFFVTRAKSNMQYEVIGQQNLPKNKAILCDQMIRLTGPLTSKKYPKELRLIHFDDRENNKVLVFLTNNFKLAASTIAQIYKARWQIELFFKWIKQNLEIKTFLGTSKNAVMIQIWVAMIVYLLLAYIKYQTKWKASLLELTRMIRERAFRKRCVNS
jgi:hypothetical protein